MHKLISYLESVPLSMSQIFIGSSGILYIRILLENFSSPPQSGYFLSDFIAVSHFLIFFWCLSLTLILILNYFSGEEIVKITRLALFGLIVTWIPPIFDLIVFGRGGVQLEYMMTSWFNLIVLFFTFFGPFLNVVISLGIRVEIFIVLIGIAWYLKVKTKSRRKTILGTLASYLAIFLWLSFPSLIKIIADIGNPLVRLISINDFLVRSFQNSTITSNLIHPSFNLNIIRANEIFAVDVVNQLGMLILFILSALWFLKYSRKKLIAVVKNSRFLRIGHYFIFITIGLLLVDNFQIQINWIYWTSIILLYLIFYCAWMFAVGTNDIEDISVDKISNPNRPLIKNEMSVEETRNINVFFLVFSLMGAALIGEYILFFILTYTFAYYIYSAPPLQLKRVPVVATFLIAIATLCATMAGYFFNSTSFDPKNFPFEYVALILIGITIGAIAKDLKDIEGDKANNVKTIPVLLNNHPNKNPIILVFALLFFALPAIIFKNLLFLIPIVPLGLIAFIIIKYKLNEKYIFTLYYLFIVATILIQSY